jgi:hypothetical protein
MEIIAKVFKLLAIVRMNKSRMLTCIVLQCGHHYISMFLTIYQPSDLTTELATWHFNTPLLGAGLYVYNTLNDKTTNIVYKYTTTNIIIVH